MWYLVFLLAFLFDSLWKLTSQLEYMMLLHGLR